MKIILASKSPRRKELLKFLVKDFEVVDSTFDESSIKISNPKKLVKVLSEKKCESVFCSTSGDRVVVGADTIVCLKKTVFGKPKTKEKAFEMLGCLSGKANKVMTGFTVICQKGEKIFKTTGVNISKVCFKKLSNEEIEDYINSGEPLDKAGAYAIQGGAGKFVRKIVGSYSGILGLPLDEIYEIFKKQNVL